MKANGNATHAGPLNGSIWLHLTRLYASIRGWRYASGRPTIRILRESFGKLAVDELGPKKVRNLIEGESIKHGWSLTYARDHMTRIRMIWKWAVSEELVNVEAYERLRTVIIRIGKHTKPLPPVSDELIEKTLPLLRPGIATMVQLQRLTGMRPGELVSMKVDDVDRSRDVWVYSPAHHKTEHRGKSRSIYIGPKAQAILAPNLLKARKYVFPAAGQSGSPYTSDSYRRAIQRVCEKHGIERWSPYQLRKSAATAIRAALDVEHAASILGHSSSIVTQDHYAAADQKRAVDAARRLG